MSALPRSTSSVREAPRLVRGPTEAPAIALAWELARAGERVELVLGEGACMLRWVTPGGTRELRGTLHVRHEAGDDGLEHLDARGEVRELDAPVGVLRVVLTRLHTNGTTRLLYVHTNALTLLAIPGGRADVVQLVDAPVTDH